MSTENLLRFGMIKQKNKPKNLSTQKKQYLSYKQTQQLSFEAIYHQRDIILLCLQCKDMNFCHNINHFNIILFSTKM